MSYRSGSLNQIRSLAELNEMPFDSVVHSLDNFPMIGSMTYAPALDDPIINMNNYKLYIANVINANKIKLSTDVVPISTAKMILTNAGVQQQLQAFRRQLSPRVMWADDITSLPHRASTQCMVNYNALFRARVMGVRRKVRFMNFLFGLIINTIMKAPDRQHFIHIPLEAIQFEKKDFIRVFKKFDRIATKFPEISSYLFLAHFYAILTKRVQLPKRGALLDPEDSVEAFTDIDPATWDPDLKAEEFFTNVSEYMSEDSEAALEELKEGENPYKISIFEFIPPKWYENINFILTCGGKFICYNLRDLKEINASGAALLRIIKHVNMLAACGVPVETETIVETPMVAEQIVTVDETGEKANQPSFDQPMTKEEKEQAADADMDELDNVEKIIETTQAKTEKKDLTPAQKEHVKTISKAYKKLMINGKTFEQVLTDVGDVIPDLPEVDLPVIEAGAMDKSATKSSTAQLDINYIKKEMDRDMVKILTSFNKQGMFLVDFKVEDQIDELNEKRTYTSQFEDLDHKKHTVKFTVPKVDEYGRFKSNGTLKVMKKQRVSNPICKVSDTRVTLNSNYNKLLLERNQNVAHNFSDWLRAALAKASSQGIRVKYTHSNFRFPNKAYPFELTEIGKRYERVDIGDASLFCRVPDRGQYAPKELVKKIEEIEKGNGYWFGYRGDEHFFMNVNGTVVVKNLKAKDGEEEPFYGAFEDFLEWLTGMEFKKLVEFVELTILNRTIPLIHALGLRYGLTDMLKYTGTDYELHNSGERFERRASDIVIKFHDKTLIVKRTPRMNALLFGGLSSFDLSDVMYEDMDKRDVYYDLLAQKRISMNLVKGIDALFDLFIDPITRDVLREMKEPTDIRDLLIRATTMLTTSEHLEEASSVNFRFRGVEQMSGIVYNELSKAFATYRNHSIGSTNHFSIKEYQIKQRIEQDQLTSNVTILNPLDDIKEFSNFSNAGSGGRSNETFKVNDRRFTVDSIGVVSEATVDNAKVGLNAVLPANPIIVNGRGMTKSIKLEDLKPENVLSLNSLVMPCATNDDAKRDVSASCVSNHT